MFQDFRARAPTAMIRDLVRFYRKVLDGIINGSQTGMEVYAEELAHLRVRWSMEKRKRVNTCWIGPTATPKRVRDGDEMTSSLGRYVWRSSRAAARPG